MNQRLNLQQAEPAAYQAMFGLEKYLASTQLTPTHKELIKIRASQINGCAYCLAMHTQDARRLGETEQRIYLLNAWREAPHFTPEEQAILALTEEITLIHQHVADATYQRAVELLGEAYVGQVIMAAVVINAWNRIAISTGLQPAVA
jgi:AhpD family alkylhydroperoxidase